MRRLVPGHRAALDDVLQLADVARPGVVHHRGEGFRADFLRDETAVGREAGQKVLDEHRDVVLALAQRRDDKMDDVEPVEQVFAKLPLRDHVAQRPVGRRNHAHVHAARGLVGADFLQFAGLEKPQQQPLHPQRHLADFVEEDGAVMRQLELARLVAIRAGEAALDVAEELRLEQRLGHAGAVHGDERTRRPRASCMHRVRDQLLAGPALPGDEDLGVGSGDVVDLFLQLANDDTVAKQLAGAFISHRLLSAAPAAERVKNFQPR